MKCAYEHTYSVYVPIVDAVPASIVFICYLFDLPGVVSRIFPQKMIGQLVEGRDCSLASAQVLEERLWSHHHGGIRINMTLKM